MVACIGDSYKKRRLETLFPLVAFPPKLQLWMVTRDLNLLPTALKLDFPPPERRKSHTHADQLHALPLPYALGLDESACIKRLTIGRVPFKSIGAKFVGFFWVDLPCEISDRVQDMDLRGIMSHLVVNVGGDEHLDFSCLRMCA